MSEYTDREGSSCLDPNEAKIANKDSDGNSEQVTHESWPFPSLQGYDVI